MLKTCLGIAITLTATVSVAHAEPWMQPQDTAYVAAGVAFAIGPFAVDSGTVTLDGGYRLAGSRWFAHGLASIGTAADDGSEGTAYQVEAGIEHRDCVRDGDICFSSGADAGYVTARLGPEMEMAHYAGPVLVARAAVDAGGRWLRVRLGTDLELGHNVTDTGNGGYNFPGVSAGLQLAMMVRF